MRKPWKSLRGYFRSKVGKEIKRKLEQGGSDVMLCFDIITSIGRCRIQTASVVHACGAACKKFNRQIRVSAADHFTINDSSGTVHEICNLRRNKVLLTFDPRSD
jgi:hypothetical protein